VRPTQPDAQEHGANEGTNDEDVQVGGDDRVVIESVPQGHEIDI
jgi:hypothetical protein